MKRSEVMNTNKHVMILIPRAPLFKDRCLVLIAESKTT